METVAVKIEVVAARPKWYVNLADFANMVKAFIGSNYLTVAFAFHQCGLFLGIGGMLFIAALTDHGCQLLGKTKHRIIDKLVLQRARGGVQGQARRSSYNSNTNTPLDSGMEEGEDSDAESSPFIAQSGQESQRYEVDNSLDEFREHLFKHMTYGDVGKYCFGKKGIAVVNFFIAFTQFGFCVAYFIFIGNTIHSLFVKEDHPPTIPHGHRADLDAVDNNSSTIMTTVFINGTTTVPPNVTEPVTQPYVPDLHLMVVSPLPIFIFFALIRSVRYMGVISVFANFCILLGCISVLSFVIDGFHVNEAIRYAKIEGFPVFFGMLTASFEGIGLVIPVESSMVGNRHLFKMFLHGALLILTLILGSFGTLGYLRYGNDVQQMLNKNIPAGNPLGVSVNVLICIGIMLTFPLQMFPVIEITERYLFTEGKICGPRKVVAPDETEQLLDDEVEASLADDDVAAHVPDSVPSWKRNVLRVLIVLLAGGLAVLLKDFFAYVGAFNGAVGSCMLGFVLPSLFHYRACGRDVNAFIRVKDISIVVFGIVVGLMCVSSVIEQIATGMIS